METFEDQIYQNLKDIIDYYGGLDEGVKKVRELIDQIEDNEKEAANERYFSRY